VSSTAVYSLGALVQSPFISMILSQLVGKSFFVFEKLGGHFSSSTSSLDSQVSQEWLGQ
jgi:hypothetical protein